jgi:hypothetical protein
MGYPEKVNRLLGLLGPIAYGSDDRGRFRGRPAAQHGPKLVSWHSNDTQYGWGYNFSANVPSKVTDSNVVYCPECELLAWSDSSLEAA